MYLLTSNLAFSRLDMDPTVWGNEAEYLNFAGTHPFDKNLLTGTLRILTSDLSVIDIIARDAANTEGVGDYEETLGRHSEIMMNVVMPVGNPGHFYMVAFDMFVKLVKKVIIPTNYIVARNGREKFRQMMLVFLWTVRSLSRRSVTEIERDLGRINYLGIMLVNDIKHILSAHEVEVYGKPGNLFSFFTGELPSLTQQANALPEGLTKKSLKEIIETVQKFAKLPQDVKDAQSQVTQVGPDAYVPTICRFRKMQVIRAVKALHSTIQLATPTTAEGITNPKFFVSLGVQLLYGYRNVDKDATEEMHALMWDLSIFLNSAFKRHSPNLTSTAALELERLIPHYTPRNGPGAGL